MNFKVLSRWNSTESRPSLKFWNRRGFIAKYFIVLFLIGITPLTIFAQAVTPQFSSKDLFGLQFKFHLIDLEDYDEAQFYESLQKLTPLFKRLSFLNNQKTLEIVYAKPQLGPIKQGVVVEIALPSGKWVDIETINLVKSVNNLYANICLVIG